MLIKNIIGQRVQHQRNERFMSSPFRLLTHLLSLGRNRRSIMVLAGLHHKKASENFIVIEGSTHINDAYHAAPSKNVCQVSILHLQKPFEFNDSEGFCGTPMEILQE